MIIKEQSTTILQSTFCNQVIESCPKAEKNPILAKFIRQFYLHFPVLTEDKPDYSHFADIAGQVFDFATSRDNEEIKINIYNPTNHKQNAKKLKYSVIEIINDDMPFLVDSVKEELAKKEIKIYQIIHPIIRVKRSKGKITDVLARSDEDGKSQLESIIYIQSTYISSKKLADKIAEDLHFVLQNVRTAVSDWRPMVQKLHEVSAKCDGYQNISETQNFLHWIGENNFTFLGYSEYSTNTKQHNATTKFIEDTELGIIKHIPKIHNLMIQEIAAHDHKNQPEISQEIFKLNYMSPVHRHTNLDALCINFKDAKSNHIVTKCFIGMFTSILAYQSVKIIPIIREKIAYVVNHAGFHPISYSGKEILSILEALPREDLLQMPKEAVFSLVMGIYNLLVSPKIKLFMGKSNASGLFNCMVFIPRERFSHELNEKIEKILAEHFGNMITSNYTQITNLPITYLYFLVNTDQNKTSPDQLETLEKRIKVLFKLWDEELLLALIKEHGENKGDTLFKKYKNAFPAAYKEIFTTGEDTLYDIQAAEKVYKSQDLMFTLHKLESASGGNGTFSLKIYSPGSKIALSEVMPILDNMGFRAVDEQLFCISAHDEDSIWMHNFQLQASVYKNQAIHDVKESAMIDSSKIKHYIEDALAALWTSKFQNDSLNKLILRASLTWRQVKLLRAIGKYIGQIGFTYREEYINEVLTSYPMLAKLMIEYFYSKFDPEQQPNAKAKKVNKISKEIEDRLGKIVSSIEDKIIRRFFEIMQAITRTNYFQTQASGNDKEYISFKLSSAKISGMPLPIPYAEIFVYSTRVEGIHLRGGKVARGGLRWSDRSEDFRTEVLGLMKAQMTKNAVIVPVGAKGGFIVKQPATMLTREEYLKEGKECYRIFLRGLLDITDNIVQGKLITPNSIIKYDEDDPYLVVAADKGTATFSDIANQISAEYQFWLGDAFASGGSAGYDHKAMGITARGAWISVERHLREIGIDYMNQTFSVVGIGDMSGDVFGNGMLMSDNIMLIGAFNHNHIFIDPHPDSKQSFKERKRLFNLPGSHWSDYNPKLISKGGGVFDRKAKTITLSNEIKQLLHIDEQELSPEQLIRKLLTAAVDLLWNGGIGTYIKASEEVNEQVGDRTNDALRVDGRDLKCKIVAEGGNLGCTQKGRIEYALNGGKINTDYIDNSAGVDCSDHEVNIKIALQKAIETRKLTNDNRNILLAKMTDEVAKLVLRDNQLQTQAISIIEQQGHHSLELLSRLITKLETRKILNRSVEFLPSNQEIAKRSSNKQGLTRPEIAVLLSYSKLTIFNDIIDSKLADDPYYNKDLQYYFPQTMRQDYADQIQTHTLRREIITTAISNSIVNRMGPAFYHFALEDLDARGSDIARAYTITREAFELRTIWNALEAIEHQLSLAEKVALNTEIYKLVSRCIFWLIRNFPHVLHITERVEEIKPAIKELMHNLEQTLAGNIKERFNEKLSQFSKMHIPKNLAHTISCISILSSAYDIVYAAQKSNKSIQQVGKIYFEIGTRFGFDWLRHCIDKTEAVNYWQRLSLKSMKDDLYDRQRRLTNSVVEYLKNGCNPIDEWVKINIKQVERFDNFIKDLSAQSSIDYPMMVVAVKRSESLIAPTEL